MKKISDYLGKFEKLEHPDLKKEFLAKLISSVIGASIKKEEVDLRAKTIFLKTNSYIKTEVFLKKKIILEKIKEELPNIRVTNIF